MELFSSEFPEFTAWEEFNGVIPPNSNLINHYSSFDGNEILSIPYFNCTPEQTNLETQTTESIYRPDTPISIQTETSSRFSKKIKERFGKGNDFFEIVASQIGETLNSQSGSNASTKWMINTALVGIGNQLVALGCDIELIQSILDK